MPGSYLIDVERGIVFSRGWGVLTDQDIAEHPAALAADPRFDPGFRQIIDFGDATEIRITTEGVRVAADRNPFRRDARRAFVVATDEAYGLSRMFWAFTESSAEQFAIFRAMAPALEWIGLDPQTPWPAQAPDKIFGEG